MKGREREREEWSWGVNGGEKSKGSAVDSVQMEGKPTKTTTEDRLHHVTTL